MSTKAKDKRAEASAKQLRDSLGLLEGLEYKFQEDGSVDWRAMADPKFLYINKDAFRDREIPESIEGLSDAELCIGLAGLKKLANIRGFHSVEFKVDSTDKNHVVAICAIRWTENYETPQTLFTEAANATLDNTDSFCAKFLESIACNRAFARCVRNFLNINVVSMDELDKSKGGKFSKNKQLSNAAPTETPRDPVSLLASRAASDLKCTTFDQFKEHLRNLWQTKRYQNAEAQNWKDYKDIPVKEARKITGILFS